MNATGKAARKRYGTRAGAKQRREAGARKKRNRKRFGELPVSEKRGNAKPWREGMPEDMTPSIDELVIGERERDEQ